MQQRVGAVRSRQQLGMAALFQHTALVEHDDVVRVLDRGQAMRDHQRGAVLHQSLHGFLDQALRFGIQRAGGLVEDQDRRVLEDRARDGDALALATGDQRPALPDRAVQPARQLADELPSVGGARGGDDVLLARVCHLAIGDVFGNGAVENHHVLTDPADLAAQMLELVALQRLPVDQNVAVLGCVEARD